MKNLSKLKNVLKTKKIRPDVLLFGDLHLHDRKELSVQDDELLIGSRFLEGINILDQIIEIVKNINIRYIIFLGDWFELKDKIPTYMLSFFKNRIKELCNRVECCFSLVGNHDFDRKGYITPFLFTTIKNFKVLGYPHNRMNLNGCSWSFIPFYRDWNDFKRAFDEVNNCDYMILHQEVPGVFPDSEIDPSFIDSLSKYTTYISGHIHKSTLFHNIFYLGSPYQVWFSEGNENKFICFLESQSKNMVLYELEAPRFIEIDLDDVLNKKIGDLKNHYVKVKGEVDEHERGSLNLIELKNMVTESGAKNVIFDIKKKKGKRASSKYKNISILDYKKTIKTFVSECEVNGLNKNRLSKIGISLVEGV